MKLCVTQLAHKNLDKLLEILSANQIDNIEVVFTLIKPWQHLNISDLIEFKNKIDALNIKATSAQSLFYGMDVSIEHVNSMVVHFYRLINYSKVLGINTLVFGSPNLRQKVPNYEIHLHSIFKQVDSHLKGTGIKIAIEPNCTEYKGEYFHTVPEIVRFIKSKPYQNITAMIDYHNVLAENMNPSKLLKEYINEVGHIHISEPKLQPIATVSDHQTFSDTIRETNYQHVITYEILHQDQPDDVVSDNIKVFKEIYEAK